MSAFYGIVILMYVGEGRHSGRPHFHAVHAGASASYDIETLEPMAGQLPGRVNRLVRMWARLHQVELLHNWRRLRAGRHVIPIDPLQ